MDDYVCPQNMWQLRKEDEGTYFESRWVSGAPVFGVYPQAKNPRDLEGYSGKL